MEKSKSKLLKKWKQMLDKQTLMEKSKRKSLKKWKQILDIVDKPNIGTALLSQPFGVVPNLQWQILHVRTLNILW